MSWADEVLAGHPFVVAHRGASAERPEHTLAAYDLALKEGADGVECDVRLTSDGHLVCVHDRRLERTSTGAGLVSTMTLAQLRELEFGAWHRSWRPDGTHGDTGLLTLDALVALVLDWHRPVKIFIETKHPVRYGALVESKVLALLQRFGIATPASADRSRAVVMSFSAMAMWRVRRAAPLLPTVLLTRAHRYLGGTTASTVGATAVGPSITTLRERPRAGRSGCGAGQGVVHLERRPFRRCPLLPRHRGGLVRHASPRPRQSLVAERPDRGKPRPVTARGAVLHRLRLCGDQGRRHRRVGRQRVEQPPGRVVVPHHHRAGVVPGEVADRNGQRGGGAA